MVGKTGEAALLNAAALTEPPARLSYPLEQPPAPGRALPLAEGVEWLRMPLPFALDHVNLWLLRDGDGYTLVDCGYALERVQRLWEGLLETRLAGGRLRRILVTHFHPDHLGLAAWLAARSGAEVWMAEAEFATAQRVWSGAPGSDRPALLELFRAHGLEPHWLAALAAGGNVFRRGVPELPARIRHIADGEEIPIDGRAWRVIGGPGHSPAHAALHCAEARLLISGDMVLPRISTNVSVWASAPEADPVRLFLESLQRFDALDPATLVLPSHGRPFAGLPARLEELRAHHAARLAEALEHCAVPRCAAELVPVLFPRPLDAHQIMFAMGEALAHLNRLWHAGALERRRGADGVFRFARRSAGTAAAV